MDTSKFFETLFDNLEGYIQLSVLVGRRMNRPLFFSTVAAFLEALGKVDPTHDVFFGVSPRAKKDNKKTGVNNITAVWADIDNCPDEVPFFPLPPTFVVHSGHGKHLYWKLTEPIPAAEGEKLVAAVGKAVGGDNVSDRTRLMRVPGSWNNKADPIQCVLQEVRPHLQYAAVDLERALGIRAKIRTAMMHEEADGFESRSERDWAIMREMRRVGLSDEVIRAVFMYLPCGVKAREEGEHYFTYTLNKVNTDLAENPSSENDVDRTLVMRDGGIFLVSTNGEKRVANFMLNLVNTTCGDAGEQLVCDLVIGRFTKRVVLTAESFGSREQLSKALGTIRAAWTGSDNQLALLHEWLVTRYDTVAQTKTTNVTGWHDNLWVGTDIVFSATEQWPADKGPISYITSTKRASLMHTTYEESDDVAALLAEVVPLLLKVNEPHNVYALLGWLAMCPFKERLFQQFGMRFPILNIVGTRASGKTEVINRVLLPLLGVTARQPIDSTTTMFVLMSVLSSSNGIPVPLAEFRSNDRRAEFLGYMRNAYDHSTNARGRADQTVQQYLLTAPIIIDGEDALPESSAVERSIQVILNPETIVQGAPANTAFQALVKLPLHQLALPYIRWTLDHALPLEKWQREFNKAFKHVAVFSDRVRENHLLVYFGMRLLQEWWATYDVVIELPDLVESLTKVIRNIVSISGRSMLLVDDFTADVVNHILHEPAQEQIPATVSPTTQTITFQLSSAYTWWATMRLRTHQPILDRGSIQRQLKEREIDLKSPATGQYVLRSNVVFRYGNVLCRGYEVNIPAIQAMGLEVSSMSVGGQDA